MANGKRYYWIKLTDEFIDSDALDTIMSREHGGEYAFMYLLLCKHTANNQGYLAHFENGAIAPYTTNRIRKVCGSWYTADFVEDALALFAEVGWLEYDINGIARVTLVDSMTGTETDYAKKMREYRESQKARGYNVSSKGYNVTGM